MKILSNKLKIKDYFITKIPDYVINKNSGIEILTELFKTNSLNVGVATGIFLNRFIHD